MCICQCYSSASKISQIYVCLVLIFETESLSSLGLFSGRFYADINLSPGQHEPSSLASHPRCGPVPCGPWISNPWWTMYQLVSVPPPLWVSFVSRSPYSLLPSPLQTCPFSAISDSTEEERVLIPFYLGPFLGVPLVCLTLILFCPHPVVILLFKTTPT